MTNEELVYNAGYQWGYGASSTLISDTSELEEIADMLMLPIDDPNILDYVGSFEEELVAGYDES